MPRTIVYPRVAKRAAAAGGSASQPDELSEKLLKYIPGEVIAFYVPMYALVPKEPAWGLWSILTLGAVGVLGYLFARADKTAPPRFYFYILAVVAFLAWALGTSTVGTDLWALPDWINRGAIPTSVFLIPMIDEVLTKVLEAD
jgi:hypothetical protein